MLSFFYNRGGFSGMGKTLPPLALRGTPSVREILINVCKNVNFCYNPEALKRVNLFK
jgi:hypothetical protein